MLYTILALRLSLVGTFSKIYFIPNTIPSNEYFNIDTPSARCFNGNFVRNETENTWPLMHNMTHEAKSECYKQGFKVSNNDMCNIEKIAAQISNGWTKNQQKMWQYHDWTMTLLATNKCTINCSTKGFCLITKQQEQLNSIRFTH